jgi:hypothetical protein
MHFITLYYTVECGGAGLDSLVIPVFVDQISITSSNIFQNVSLYPNPNKGSFRLQANFVYTTNVSFEVYNAMGQKVYQNTYHQASFINEEFQLNLSSGVYIYKLVNSNEVFNGKFIVE